MSNHATIFLIDLGERASAMQKTLSTMGFQVGAGSREQLAEVIGQALPHVIVAPEPILVQLKAVLEQTPGGGEVLLFLLSEDAAALSHRVPTGATARVPADIDPGVLGLRIQAAAQTFSSVRNRQATLVGFSAAALSPPAHNAPSIPPELKPAPVSDRVPPSNAAWPSSAAAPAPPSFSAGLPPPQAPVSQAPVSQAPMSHAALSQAPVSQAPVSLPEPSATAASPVALTLPPAGLETGGGKKKIVFASAAAAIVLLGVGAYVLSGSSTEGTIAAGESAQMGEARPGGKDAAVAPAAPADSVAPAGSVAPPESPAPADSAALADPAAPHPDAESALFQIASPTKLESCEKLLGKSEEDFKSTAKWRSGQAWTLARKSLMSGKQDQAAKQMCESAFIDPRGPAVAGLVNFYLSERALEQAHKWALKGVEVSPKSRAAKEALGDVLNQMGRVAEARDIWLESFGLEEKDEAKLAGVVKNYVRSAIAARRGGADPLAERLLRRALSFDPENAEAVALFVTTLRKNGEDKLADQWESRASKL